MKQDLFVTLAALIQFAMNVIRFCSSLLLTLHPCHHLMTMLTYTYGSIAFVSDVVMPHLALIIYRASQFRPCKNSKKNGRLVHI
jgi:hypothetical protein